MNNPTDFVTSRHVITATGEQAMQNSNMWQEPGNNREENELPLISIHIGGKGGGGQQNADLNSMAISTAHNVRMGMTSHHEQQIYAVNVPDHMNPIQQRYNTRSSTNSYYVAHDMQSHLQPQTGYDIGLREFDNYLGNEMSAWNTGVMEIPFGYEGSRKQWTRHPGKHVGTSVVDQNPCIDFKRRAMSPVMDNSYFQSPRKLRKVSLKASEPKDPEQDKNEFGLVPGRMSLLSCNKKYRVTVGEIKRRVNPPECLNASLLGGILRRAKSKNGGNQLRKEIADLNVELPAGRRKAANVTLLTSLVEAEAIHLANDFQETCEQDFPTRECAQYILKETCFDPNQKRNMIICAKSLVSEFLGMMSRIQVDIYKKNYTDYMHEEPECFFNTFNYMTHGFGIPAVCTTLKTFTTYCDELLQMLGNYA